MTHTDTLLFVHAQDIRKCSTTARQNPSASSQLTQFPETRRTRSQAPPKQPPTHLHKLHGIISPPHIPRGPTPLHEQPQALLPGRVAFLPLPPRKIVSRRSLRSCGFRGRPSRRCCVRASAPPLPARLLLLLLCPQRARSVGRGLAQLFLLLVSAAIPVGDLRNERRQRRQRQLG